MIVDMDCTLNEYTVVGVVNEIFTYENFFAKTEKQARYFFQRKFGFKARNLIILGEKHPYEKA
jgi:hypothetical protein